MRLGQGISQPILSRGITAKCGVHMRLHSTVLYSRTVRRHTKHRLILVKKTQGGPWAVPMA